jgi:hypothetical protein
MRASVKKVLTNAHDSFLVREHWLVGETFRLMHCHRNVGTCTILKIQHHTNSSVIFPLQFLWLFIQIMMKKALHHWRSKNFHQFETHFDKIQGNEENNQSGTAEQVQMYEDHAEQSQYQETC